MSSLPISIPMIFQTKNEKSSPLLSRLPDPAPTISRLHSCSTRSAALKVSRVSGHDREVYVARDSSSEPRSG